MKIACGCYHSVILSEDHEVFTFGRGNHGQLGHGSIFESRIPKQVAGLLGKRAVKIAAGFYHTVILVDQRTGKEPGSLSVALEKLLKNTSRADVIFMVEGKEIYGHRCIIYARCKELDILIKKEGIKIESGKPIKTELKINDVGYETFQKILTFLYTDKIELQYDKAQPKYLYTKQLIELMAWGEKLKLEKLRSIAEYHAKKSLTIDSAVVALKAACELENLSFKALCMDYVVKHFVEVIGNPAFSELSPIIRKEVLSEASKTGTIIKDNQKT